MTGDTDRSRWLTVIAVFFAILMVAAVPAAGAQTVDLDYDSELVPDPEIQDTVTISEHDGEEMSSVLEYYDDNADVASLADDGAEVRTRDSDDRDDDSPHNPVTLRADRIEADAFTSFPRNDAGIDTWADQANWTTGSNITVANTSSAAGADALSFTNDEGSMSGFETAVIDISESEYDSNIQQLMLQTVVNVNSLTSSAEAQFRVYDTDGDYVEAKIDPDGAFEDQDVIADQTGNGFIYQEKLGDLTNGGDLDDIDNVTVRINDSDVDFDLIALSLDATSKWDFGTQEVADSDDDDSVDTETVYNTSGEFSINDFDTVGDTFDEAIFNDLKVDVTFKASNGIEAADFRWSEADSYPSFDHRLELLYQFELPTAFDLVYAGPELIDTQLFPDDRYLTVDLAESEDDTTDFEEVDDEDITFTDKSGSYTNDDEQHSLSSTVSSGDVAVLHYDVLVTDGERDNIEDSGPAGGPTEPASSQGLLDLVFSVPGIIVSSIVGFLGMRRLGWLGGEGS